MHNSCDISGEITITSSGRIEVQEMLNCLTNSLRATSSYEKNEDSNLQLFFNKFDTRKNAFLIPTQNLKKKYPIFSLLSTYSNTRIVMALFELIADAAYPLIVSGFLRFPIKCLTFSPLVSNTHVADEIIHKCHVSSFMTVVVAQKYLCVSFCLRDCARLEE